MDGKKFAVFVLALALILASCKGSGSAANQTPPTTPPATANMTPVPTTIPPTGTNVTTPPPPPATPNLTVSVGKNPAFSGYLTDGAGRTLYYFAGDIIGKSNASNTTTVTWPVFYASAIVVSQDLVAGDFGTITRSDGTMQTTYQGWPLYYYSKDQVPGDTLGNGIGGLWFVLNVPSYSIMLLNKKGVGTYLADNKGMTLYWTTSDSIGKSTIEQNDLAIWPAFNPQSISFPSALNATDFDYIMRLDFTQQLTYNGYPLYSYSGDNVPGDTNGQGVGGVWSVVNASAPGPGMSSSPVNSTPTLKIIFPSDGDALPAGNISVSVNVTNFNIVDKQGQVNVAGEGHLHFYLDAAAPVTPGQPAVPADGTWAHVSGNTYTFNNVASGTHTITVQLVNNDHTPIIPVVIATITVIVILI